MSIKKEEWENNSVIKHKKYAEKRRTTMKKWNMTIAVLLLVLSLGSIAGCGNNTTENKVENKTDKGNVVEDMVDDVKDAGKDVIDGVEEGVDDLTNDAVNGSEKTNP